MYANPTDNSRYLRNVPIFLDPSKYILKRLFLSTMFLKFFILLKLQNIVCQKPQFLRNQRHVLAKYPKFESRITYLFRSFSFSLLKNRLQITRFTRK